MLQSEMRAQEIDDLPVRVYEIHDVIIRETGGLEGLHDVSFLEISGHLRPVTLPIEEVIRFCVEIAEENAALARGDVVESKTVAQIASWFRQLLGVVI